ncbi:UbiA family prenyltransferase [Thermoplasmatota archaeon]
MSIKNMFKLYITVSRWEFLPAVLIGILIGIFIGADSIQSLISYEFTPILIEGILIFILLFNVGFMVNCWADWKVDELYKTKLYHSVIKMGRNKLGILVILHIIISIILAYHITVQLARIEVSLLVWIGIFLGVGYSIEPFRFKRRGLLHSLIALPIFFIPGIYSYLLVNSLSITAPYTIIFISAAIGITLGHYSLILVSQAEDTPADKKMNLITPAVKWGLKKTLKISYKTNFIGSVVIIFSLMIMFLTINYWLLLLVPIIIIGRYFSMIEVYKLYKNTLNLSSEDDILSKIREKMDVYPIWHAYGLSGVTISSLCILIVKTMNWNLPILFL